ncbi:MAG: pentapeptide repeat-containing protein [Candidatus Zixiibacteriota bacterium]
MANPEHVRIVKQGEEAIEKWKRQNPDVLFDLSGAELSGIQIADLGSCPAFVKADLRNAVLRDVFLGTTYMTGADLRGASLDYARVYDCALDRANLRGAHLGGARFEYADFVDSDLSESDCHSTTFIHLLHLIQ